MEKIHKKNKYSKLLSELAIDCNHCSGLCCVALYFAKTEGFPSDKDAGKPCRNLMPDFKCTIHSKLMENHMKGCLAYDCLGAGQKVTRMIYQGENWKSNPKLADQMYSVFHNVFYLHQMLWYLIEAWSVTSKEEVKTHINTLIVENEQMTQLSPEKILNLDIENYRIRVNLMLKESGELLYEQLKGSAQKRKQIDLMGKNFKKANLLGVDLSMTLLIAANLEGCNLYGANFLGADLRDANIQNTDLSNSIFLTQSQINSAIGNHNTKLPNMLKRPINWTKI